MSKSLASYPAEKRTAVILRRLKTPGHGNGYWAAVAAAQKLGISAGGKKATTIAQKVKRGEELEKRLAGRAKHNQLRRKPMVHKNTPRTREA